MRNSLLVGLALVSVLLNAVPSSADYVSLESRWIGEKSAGAFTRIYDASFPGWGRVYEIGRLVSGLGGLSDAVRSGVLKEVDRRVGRGPRARARSVDPKLLQLRDMALKIDPSRETPPQWDAIVWRKKPTMVHTRGGEEQPADFRLSDIVLPEKVESSWLADYLRETEFQRGDDGSYRILWNPEGAHSASDWMRTAVDFQKPESVFRDALIWHGLEEGLGQLTGLIPIPLVAALVDTALGRLFHFMDLVEQGHLNMLLQLMADPNRLTALQGAERDTAITGLMFAQSSLEEAFQWLWKKPLEEWANAQETEKQNASDSRAWLMQQGTPVTDVGVRFGFTSSSGSEDSGLPSRWFSLGQRELDASVGPQCLVDFSDPNGILETRIWIEALSTLVSFGTHFIPTIGGALDALYGMAVEDPENQNRVWEMRLLGTLESDSGEWSAERDALGRQILNPMEFTPDDAAKAVADRRKSLGL